MHVSKRSNFKSLQRNRSDKRLLPTIMWLQMSQKVGFLKMYSMKQWPVGSIIGCWAVNMGGQMAIGAGHGMKGGKTGQGGGAAVAGATPQALSWPVLLLTSNWKLMSPPGRWKKLSALLLRRLLVLKDSERFSFCSFIKQSAEKAEKRRWVDKRHQKRREEKRVINNRLQQSNKISNIV